MRQQRPSRTAFSAPIAAAILAIPVAPRAFAQSLTPAHQSAVAAPTTSAHSAARGVARTIEVQYTGGTLRAKPLRDSAAPMLVRVAPVGDPSLGKFRIEYLGLVSGEYDLSSLIELDDGRPANGLAPILVRVQTQLPKEHGTDVFGLASPGLWLGGHYRLLIGALAALWVLVPIIIVGRNLARRKPRALPLPPAREPTPIELLGELIAVAEQRDLSGSERGRLELLLLRVLRERDGDAIETPGQLASAIARLRREPRTASLVRSVEQWLHAGGDASHSATSVTAAIAELRAMKPASPEGGAR
jgi:hypothetical protein